jgi:hypothetical protein
MADNQVIEITPTGEKVIVKEVVKEVIVYKHYRSKALPEAKKRYAERHPEKIREMQRNYYQKNKERLAQKQREAYARKKLEKEQKLLEVEDKQDDVEEQDE